MVKLCRRVRQHASVSICTGTGIESTVECCCYQEFEQLMKENDLLEQKLRNQEDDFRLQNEALMKELAQVLVLSLPLYNVIIFIV